MVRKVGERGEVVRDGMGRVEGKLCCEERRRKDQWVGRSNRCKKRGGLHQWSSERQLWGWWGRVCGSREATDMHTLDPVSDTGRKECHKCLDTMRKRHEYLESEVWAAK